MSEDDLIVDLEEYLSAGVHIGTKFKTSSMSKFIYKTNNSGLTILNIKKIDERLRIAIKFLSKFEPKDILIVGRRENSWQAIKQFSKLTKTKKFIGRYPTGRLTNPSLKDFIEPKIVVVTDPWIDKNVIQDALKTNIPIISLCDSNNNTQKIDLVIPCNNKGSKSLALIYWIIANGILHERGDLTKKQKLDVPVDEFMDE